jgi:hypothetical protein
VALAMLAPTVASRSSRPVPIAGGRHRQAVRRRTPSFHAVATAVDKSRVSIPGAISSTCFQKLRHSSPVIDEASSSRPLQNAS